MQGIFRLALSTVYEYKICNKRRCGPVYLSVRPCATE